MLSTMFTYLLKKYPVDVLPGHAGVNENDRANRLVSKVAITNGLRFGRWEVLMSLRRIWDNF